MAGERTEMRRPAVKMTAAMMPHRKMAADSARTENANPHGVEILLGGKGVASFHKPWPDATGLPHRAGCGGRGLGGARNLVVQSTFIRAPSSL